MHLFFYMKYQIDSERLVLSLLQDEESQVEEKVMELQSDVDAAGSKLRGLLIYFPTRF